MALDLQTVSLKFTEDTLRAISETIFSEKIGKLNFIISSATSKGDNYLTCVYRIKVEASSEKGRTHETSLIVKGLPQVLARRKTFRSVEVFRNEVKFYDEALPKLLAFQEKKKLKVPFDSIPRCYGSLADGENDYLVLEDLSYEGGYGSANRLEALDFTHCRMIFQLLGRFHGLSLAMKNQEPEKFQELANSLTEVYYYKENKPWYQNMMVRLIDIAEDAVLKECPNTIYEEKFKKFTHNLYDHLTDLVNNGRDPYGVVGHGDTWAPNFLFRYDKATQEPEDVKIIDFQLARCSSPVLDLSFFMYSCTTKELRDNHFEDLVKAYHNSLSEFVRNLGSDPDIVFPYSALQSEWTKYGSFGLGMSLESVPMSLVEDTDVPDLDKIIGDEAIPLEEVWTLRPIKDKDGRLRLVNNIIHAADCGFI